jgi:serine/threonine protein kinase
MVKRTRQSKEYGKTAQGFHADRTKPKQSSKKIVVGIPGLVHLYPPVKDDPLVREIEMSQPVRLLGEGGYGRVQLYETKSGLKVAKKTMHMKFEENENAAKREAERRRVLEDLRGELLLVDSLVPYKVYNAYWVQQDEHIVEVVILMEFIEGENGFDLGRTLTAVETRELLRYLLDWLSILDIAGAVHRDIKPENVIFNLQDPQRPFTLVDWGLSCSHVDLVNYPRCLSTEVYGTKGYISPFLYGAGSNLLAEVI